MSSDQTTPFARYLALGWSVIPMKRGTKVPQSDLLPEVADPNAEGGRRRSWKPFQERHPTKDEIAAWEQHTTNIAVVLGHLSGIIVLDLDSETAIRAATERGLPRTATARSSKGPHLYFKHPGGRVRNYRDEAEGWDLKGDGGLVNAPPSIHPTGVVYEWELPPEEVGIAEAPAWLLQIIRAGQERDATERVMIRPSQSTFIPQEEVEPPTRRRTLYFERALGNALDSLRLAGEGSRNHTLNRVAYALGQLIAGAEAEQGNPTAKQEAEQLESHIRQELMSTATSIGLARREADLTMTSGLKSGKKKPLSLPDFASAPVGIAGIRKSPAVAPFGRDKREVAQEDEPPIPQSKGKGKSDKPSESNLLIELGMDATFFHTDTGERYARYAVGTRLDTGQVNHPKSPFRLWLHRRFYEAYGEPPAQNAMSQALQHLEQVALYDGDQRKVFTRIGAVANVIYLYIGDQSGQIVKVDGSGWEIVPDAPIIFRTTRNGEALPLPQHGGSLDLLRPYVNVADDTGWKLLIGWLMGSLNPWGPYAHLALRGEQDTGKSTLLRILRMFTDPAKAEENSDPKSVDDFMVTTLNNHVVSYDNLSSIPDWLSDALCRIATGAGLTKRMLYSDLEEIVIDTARPALINGIADVITRPDLLERTIVVELPRIAASRRLTERALLQQLRQDAPRIMGVLLDGVAMALRRQDTVRLPRLPRMADFVTWVEAAAPALGWSDGEFLEAYEANIVIKEENALEMDEVAQGVVQWVDHRIGANGPPITITMKELLGALTTLDGEAGDSGGKGNRVSPDWPRSPRELTSRLARAQPILRKFGVEIVKGAHTRKGLVYHISRSKQITERDPIRP